MPKINRRDRGDLVNRLRQAVSTGAQTGAGLAEVAGQAGTGQGGSGLAGIEGEG